MVNDNRMNCKEKKKNRDKGKIRKQNLKKSIIRRKGLVTDSRKNGPY